MNKKISAVLISALMVLTMFSALVPTASAAETVTPPYEFIGVADTLNTSVNATLNNVTLTATSEYNPSIMYYDIDDQNGAESLSVTIEKTLKILNGNLQYTSEIWEDEGHKYVSYLGHKYYVVDPGSSEWILSQVLVEEKEADDHLLRVGETLTLAEGFSITALEIDVEGKKAWLSVSKDGEELKNLVVKEQDIGAEEPGEFNYTEDLGADEDTTVVSFIVDTVFAGMNTNLVKINTVNLISMATETLESGTDTINDYDITLSSTIITIDNDEDISLSSDDLTEIMDRRFWIRVSESKKGGDGADTYSVGIAKVLTEPGTYELFGVVGFLNNSINATDLDLTANSMQNPSIMYYDLDDQKGDENLTIRVNHTSMEILQGDLIYRSILWEDDDKQYVSYLGNKYYVVDPGSSEWILSQVLVEEKEADDHLLRVGETLTLAEGFSITALEIDVEGKKAWLSVSKDGEELKNLVVKEQDIGAEEPGEFNYTEDLGADDDTTVVSFIVDTVFAGMNTNLVKINTVNLISMATETLESGTDTINDYDITLSSTTITIDNDEDISLGEDDITDIMDGRFAIRVGETVDDKYGDGDVNVVAIVKVITIEGEVPTATKTAAPDETPTAVGTDDGEVGTGDGTPVATVAPTEVPTPEPTPEPEPGFEAIFAVAGLLAVAYLVLRQRD